MLFRLLTTLIILPLSIACTPNKDILFRDFIKNNEYLLEEGYIHSLHMFLLDDIKILFLDNGTVYGGGGKVYILILDQNEILINSFSTFTYGGVNHVCGKKGYVVTNIEGRLIIFNRSKNEFYAVSEEDILMKYFDIKNSILFFKGFKSGPPYYSIDLNSKRKTKLQELPDMLNGKENCNLPRSMDEKLTNRYKNYFNID